MLAGSVENIEQGSHRIGQSWQDDTSLVEAAKQGDRVAFEILLGRHKRMIFFKALRVTGNREDAEDVVQQSFHNALVHLNDFEGRSSFSTWLMRIALNEALMLRRKCWKWREVSMDEPGAGEETSCVARIADSGPDPEDRYFQQERRRILFAAINELKPGMRSALHSFDLNERSLEETGRLLGLSAGAVKSRLNRARKALRHKLNRRIEFPAQAARAQAREPKRLQRPN
jgi:RNA polymerase sigma-70 factor (ECF subfamily)